MFKILRRANTEVVLTLIGRMSIECLPELKSVIASERNMARIALDLKDVTLVDREVVDFLGQCEKNQITLENCPAYVRGWIDVDRRRKSRRKK